MGGDSDRFFELLHRELKHKFINYINNDEKTLMRSETFNCPLFVDLCIKVAIPLVDPIESVPRLPVSMTALDTRHAPRQVHQRPWDVVGGKTKCENSNIKYRLGLHLKGTCTP